MEEDVQWDERIGRRLKLRDVNILLAVVQWGGMAKAARRLAVSQPVVSKAIADLEHVLGVRLLDRDRHGVEPTPYGRALLDHGVAAFDELKQAVKKIEFLSDPTVGEVRVGGTPPMVEAVLPVVIARLYRSHPRLTIQVTQARTGAALYQTLRERRVDCVVGRVSAPTIEKDLKVESLFHEPLFVVAGRRNQLTRRRRIELAELIDEPWVLPPGPSEPGTAGSIIRDAFASAGLPAPQAVVVSPSIQMHHALLTMGPFLGMLPRSVLHFGAVRHSLKVLPVKLKAKPGPAGIVTLRNRMLSPAVQLFCDSFREVVRPLAKS
jgi:DNA-binding transcriptional LysR family regulator